MIGGRFSLSKAAAVTRKPPKTAVFPRYPSCSSWLGHIHMSNQLAAVDPSSIVVPPAGRRRSVLVVTEDAALARACREMLPAEGFDVTAASHSGHALLECLEGHRADLLLTELTMPEGSGRVLATRLRRYFPQMQTLYVARAGLAHEAADVLVRPFSVSELVARIRACVSSSPAS